MSLEIGDTTVLGDPGDGVHGASVLARAFRGKSFETVWNGEDFVEPENPAPFKLTLRNRSSRHGADSGRVDMKGDSALVTIRTPYHKGRLQLAHDGEAWPKKIVIRLDKSFHPKAKGRVANDFRIANGKIGIGASQRESLKVIAGKKKGGHDLGAYWREGFLNEGNPKNPVKVAPVKVSFLDDGVVEYVIPSVITDSNPSSICFEWGIDGKVF